MRRRAGRSRIERADIAAVRATESARESLSVRALGAAAEVADQPPLFSICAATLGVGLLSGDRRLARVGGRMLAAELIATAIKSVAKRLVDRTRPHLLIDEGRYELKPGERSHGPVNSFPSGHTAGAVAVARAVARGYPGAALPAYAAAAAVAGIQVPRARHYPTDIVAGALVGLIAEAAVERVWRRVAVAAGQSPARPVERFVPDPASARDIVITRGR